MIDYLRLMLTSFSDWRVERRDERGASAVEYGLLVGGIAALLVLVVFAFGDNIRDTFTTACDGVNGVEAGCATD